jgi:hypothetical protein
VDHRTLLRCISDLGQKELRPVEQIARSHYLALFRVFPRVPSGARSRNLLFHRLENVTTKPYLYQSRPPKTYTMMRRIDEASLTLISRKRARLAVMVHKSCTRYGTSIAMDRNEDFDRPG